MKAYIVSHPEGDKFAVSAENGKDARDKVLQRVEEEFGEKWSTADVKVHVIGERPVMVNNHTWMTPLNQSLLSKVQRSLQKNGQE